MKLAPAKGPLSAPGTRNEVATSNPTCTLRPSDDSPALRHSISSCVGSGWSMLCTSEDWGPGLPAGYPSHCFSAARSAPDLGDASELLGTPSSSTLAIGLHSKPH